MTLIVLRVFFVFFPTSEDVDDGGDEEDTDVFFG